MGLEHPEWIFLWNGPDFAAENVIQSVNLELGAISEKKWKTEGDQVGRLAYATWQKSSTKFIFLTW